MNLVTAGWVLWNVAIAAAVFGFIYEAVVRPRRQKRLADLARIAAHGTRFDVDRALADGHSPESILRKLAARRMA